MAKDHFEKHFYQKDRVDWNFNLLFDGQSPVAEMARKYAEIIHHPGLYDPIPTLWLHSTILRVGFIEDYSEQEMLHVAAKLKISLAGLELPQFSFDSWWLWGGNVVLHISPDDEFYKIYHHVITALESVVGSDRTTKSPHGGFIAHTGIAYAKTHSHEDEIHAKLVKNPIEPASFTAEKLSLIRQWPTAGHYEWEIVENIAIGKV